MKTFLVKCFDTLFPLCAVCGRNKLRCECGWTTAIILGVSIAGLAISAAAAGYSAYSASEQQAQQRKAAKYSAQQQADAEKAAGEARRRQVEYDAKRRAAGMRSREAAAGVQIGQGSLLEDEMAYEADAEYAAQMAQFGFTQQEVAHRYEARIFGKRNAISPAVAGAISGGSTLATGAGSLAGRYYYQYQPTSTQSQAS